MQFKITLVFVMLLFEFTYSQNKVQGIYSLQGVHDMAASFKFTADNKFQFEYYYGAVDRFASGTFTIDGDTIKLKSDKEAGKDFAVSKQSKVGKGFKIVVKDDNKVLINQVRCIFVKGDEMVLDDVTGNQGTLETENIDCDKIYLQHPFYTDVATLIKDENNSNNYFEVVLNPSISQISFKGIDLFINGDTLTCYPNYFLPFENIKFVKAE